jgi:hypothetical protein
VLQLRWAPDWDAVRFLLNGGPAAAVHRRDAAGRSRVGPRPSGKGRLRRLREPGRGRLLVRARLRRRRRLPQATALRRKGRPRRGCASVCRAGAHGGGGGGLVCVCAKLGQQRGGRGLAAALVVWRLKSVPASGITGLAAELTREAPGRRLGGRAAALRRRCGRCCCRCRRRCRWVAAGLALPHALAAHGCRAAPAGRQRLRLAAGQKGHVAGLQAWPSIRCGRVGGRVGCQGLGQGR